MNKRIIYISILLFCAEGLIAQDQPAAADKPNVVFILADDLGWGDIAVNNSDPSYFRYTPNIDKICNEGVYLGNYNTHCVCSPSRAGILTAKHYARVMAGPTTGGELPYENTMTIGKEFQNNGYVTGCFGKWHNSAPEIPPGAVQVEDKADIIEDNNIFEYEAGTVFGIGVNNYGFDKWTGYFGGGNDMFVRYPNQQKQATWWDDENYVGSDAVGYTTDLITEAALKFIDSNKDSNFFCYVPQQAVHMPLHIKKSELMEFCEKLDTELGIPGQWDYVKAIVSPVTGRSIEEADENLHCATDEEFSVKTIDSAQTHYNHLIFGAYLYSLDKSVGCILDTVEALGLKEHTIVVFTSDNGGLKEGCSLPFQGGKHSLWEGGVRVPAAIWWPGTFDANTAPYSPGNNTYNGNLAYYDWYPTLMDMTGITFTALDPDGMSFWDELRSDSPLRTGFEDPIYEMWSNYGSVRTDEWKLMYSETTDRTELYHYLTDTAEALNVAAGNPAITSKMVGLYKDWLTDNKYAVPYVKLEESNIYSQKASPAGEIMEIEAWQNDTNNKGVFIQLSTSNLTGSKLGYYVEPGDRMEYDIYVDPDSENAKGIYYSPVKNDIPLFDSLSGINQYGEEVYQQELPRGEWIRNIVGYGSKCPNAAYRNNIVFLEGDTGYYHFYVDNIVLRKSDGSIRSVLWRSESDIAVLRFVYDFQNSKNISDMLEIEGFPFSDIQVSFTNDIPGAIIDTTFYAKLIQHLDASVDTMVNTDASDVVTSWIDKSDFEHNALPAAGAALYPSSKTFENGLDGIDLRDSPVSMQLLSAEASDIILNQDVNQKGFCIVTAVYIDSIGSNWNDLIGNSTVVTGGFLMRYSEDGKMQACLAGVKKNGSKIIEPGQTVIFSFNYDAVNETYYYWCSATDEEITGEVSPADFSSGTPLMLGSITDSLRYFDGMVGEVQIYDASIPKDDLELIVLELEEKWKSLVPDTSSPSIPQNLQAEAMSGSQIDLRWDASNDNMAVAGYYVFRNGIKIAVETDISFSDTGLDEGTSYDYFVMAYDEANNESLSSDTITVSTLIETGAGNLRASGGGLKVYPNPSKGLVYVSIQDKNESELYMELYAADGSKVRSHKIQIAGKGIAFKIDISTLNNGIYVYRFTGKDINSTGRILINK